MSIGFGILYPAPTMDGAIFNQSDFTSFGSSGLTYDQAKDYFVTYPISQGGEQTFLGDLNIAGELYADGGATIGSVNTNTSFEQTSNILTITNNFSGSNQIDFQTTNLSWNGVTLGTGGAGGDVYLAATQTFTGVNSFDNSNGIVFKNTATTATTTSIFQNSDTNCHFASSVVGGGIRITDPNVGATLAVNANGLTINKGLQLGNTVGTNIVQMVADATTNNQLDITGSLLVSNDLFLNTFPIQSLTTLPTTPIPLGVPNYGLALGWNITGNSGGEVDFISYGQAAGNIGGFDFYATNVSFAPVAIAQLRGTTINFEFTPTQPTLTYPITTNNDGSATIGYVNDAISGLPNLITSNNTWTGTNAFNTTTPTTTITQTFPQTTNTTDFSTIGYVNDAISAVPSTASPIGTILMWGGNSFAPTGYVFCSGQSLSTTGTYASLFAVLGYTYGGSGANFNVPAFHNGNYGVMPIGAQYTYGSPIGVVQSGGDINTVYNLQTYNGNGSYLTANQIAPHNHTINPPQSSYTYSLNISSTTTTGGTASRATGSNQATFPTATNGMTNFTPSNINQLQAQYYPPYCAVMFIIKYI